MLKTVFFGSKNDFNQTLVHWLSQKTNLTGVVWIRATAWQKTWSGRLAFARRRFRRYGLLKVINETLFFLYYHRFIQKDDTADMYEHIIHPYWKEHGNVSWTGDAIFASDVNEQPVLDFLRERQPDVAFAMCINNYFDEELRSIPKHGVLLWHEGITPEYKGLYAPFWAAHNLDFDNIGYTLLRMNEKFDAGEILIQGAAENVDPTRHNHIYIGHKAIMDSLPEVDGLLTRLEAGSARPLARPDAKPGYYTYPGITDLIRQRVRLRRRSRKEQG